MVLGQDIVGQPCLYADGTCRYDIEQGAAGTCWFLAILTSLADKPEYMGQVSVGGGGAC